LVAIRSGWDWPLKTRRKEHLVNADAKKGYGSTLALMLLGVLALYGGAQWLMALVPAAIVIYFVTGYARFGIGRNGRRG
jgi:hypothetical protein